MVVVVVVIADVLTVGVVEVVSEVVIFADVEIKVDLLGGTVVVVDVAIVVVWMASLGVVVKAGVVDEEVAPNIVLVLLFVDEVVGFALFPKVVREQWSCHCCVRHHWNNFKNDS